MLPENKRQAKSTDNPVTPTTENVDTDVLLTVQREYSLMEQEHARIRAEALAAGSDQRHGKDQLLFKSLPSRFG